MTAPLLLFRQSVPTPSPCAGMSLVGDGRRCKSKSWLGGVVSVILTSLLAAACVSAPPCELWPHHRCLLHLPTMHAAQCVHSAHTAADCGTHACDSAALALGTVTWEVVCRLFLCFLPFTLSNRCQMVSFFSLSDQNPSCSGQQFLPVSPQSQLLLPEAPGTLWDLRTIFGLLPPQMPNMAILPYSDLSPNVTNDPG